MTLAAVKAFALVAPLVLGGVAWGQTSQWLKQPPADDWRVMSMRGAPVKEINGEEIGRIVDFLVGHGGRLEAAIIDIERLTREAGTQIAVSFDQLQISVAGAANAEDLARGGSAPEIPSEPKLSGPDGSSVAAAVRKVKREPITITIRLSKDEIRKAPRFTAAP